MRDVPIISLLDANATAGEGNGANFSASCFEDIIAGSASFLPALDGDHRPTHVDARAGKWRRIDFLGLPLTWTGAVESHFVLDDSVLAPGERVDHRVVGASVRLAFSKSTKPHGDVACRRTLAFLTTADKVKEAWKYVPSLPAQWRATMGEQARS